MDFDYTEDWLELHSEELENIENLMSDALYESNGYAGLVTASTPALREKLEWIESESLLYGNALFERHDCGKHLAIRTREVRGGNKHFVYQCQICGEQRRSALSKKMAMEKNGGTEPAGFDDLLIAEYESYRSRISKNSTNIHSIRGRLTAILRGFGRLDDTTSKDELRRIQEQKDEEKKQRLSHLESSISDSLEKIAVEFGDEKAISYLMTQIVSRKKMKHEELLKSTDRFSSEEELKQWFKANLSDDFEIYEEVWGTHLAEDVNVRIDFILYPKEHLIAEGFITEPFGVEAKYFKQESGFTRKTSRGIWQAISYNDCVFHLDNQNFKIKFCLLFSNLSFSEESKLIKNFGLETENDTVEWSGMLHVANHARVGKLSVRGDKGGIRGWTIGFVGGSYFSCYSNDKEKSFHLSDPHVIEKVRVGNF